MTDLKGLGRYTRLADIGIPCSYDLYHSAVFFCCVQAENPDFSFVDKQGVRNSYPTSLYNSSLISLDYLGICRVKYPDV